MKSQHAHHIIKIYFLIMAVFLFSCIKMEQTMQGPFISFKEEQNIWNQWIRKNIDTPNPLEPFFSNNSLEYYKEVEEKIFYHSKNTDSFFLIFRKNIENAIDDVVLITKKGEGWLQIKWEKKPYDILKETVQDFAGFSDEICGLLTGNAFFIDINDYRVFHATSNYIFLHYNGKNSRFAFYDTTEFRDPAKFMEPNKKSEFTFFLLDSIIGKIDYKER